MTWNVRTLYQCEHPVNIKQEMNRQNINILDAFENRWGCKGNFISDTHRIKHADKENNEKSVELILDNDMKRCVLRYCQISASH